jgi:DNA-binding NtrC family response regulator
MNPEKIIKGKRVLIVDDEDDVLKTLEDLLGICKIDSASSYEEAKKLIEMYPYDIAVLDIMGVRGYDLLKLTRSYNIPALMLTAHALSSEDLKRSVDEGAAYYAPKEKINDITQFVADVLEAIEKDKSPWQRMLDRLGSFYDRRFGGPDWREKKKEFWENKVKERYPFRSLE